MPHPKTNFPLELALLGLLALLWGSSYLFVKIAVQAIPPVTLIAARVSIAAVVLCAVMMGQGRRLPSDARTWRMLLVQAFFNSIGSWTILAWGQQYVDSSLASVLNSTSPIFVFFITAFVTRHEVVGARKFVGACLGVVGVVLIVGVDALQGLGHQIAGQMAALCGAFLYACAAIYGKRFSDLPATVTAAGTMICAAACLVPLSLLVDRPWTLEPAGRHVFAAVVLGVFCTGGALLLYFRLLKTLGSMGVASQSYLRAGVGVALGIVFLGEHISMITGIGLVLAIAGVAAINAPVSTPRVHRAAQPNRDNA